MKERIPLPKNIVLMSLIEASQLVQHSTATNQLITNGLQGLGESPYTQLQDADDVERNRIRIGAGIVNAACGTYAVAKKQGGLTIISKRPASDHACNSNNINRICKTLSLIDVEDDYGYEGKGSFDNSADDSWKRNVEEIVVNNVKKKVHNNSDDLMLRYGDRIQVVSIVDNWAKLARGYGYVYLENESDLVKVGGALDKAASIEAMIYSLSYGHNKLLEVKTSAERDAISLLKELQTTLLKEDDLTVIGAEAFAEEKKDEDRDDGNLGLDYSASFSLNGNISGKSIDVRSQSGDCGGHIREDYPSDEKENSKYDYDVGDATAAADDNDDDSIGAHQRYQSRSLSIHQPIKRSLPININTNRATNGLSFLDCALCGLQSFISGEAEVEAEVREDHRDDDQGLHLSAHTMYSSTQMVQAAQEWRERNGKEASEYTHIGFRTGLSGHSGFQSSYAQDHQQQSKGGRKLRMSAHCGLTPKRRPRRKHSSNSSYLSFGGYSSFG